MHWKRKWQPTPVFLPGRIPGMGEPGGLPSMGSHRVGYDWSDLAAAAKASRGALFLPPSDVYVRSFLYLFYTLIKLNYTKVLRDQASSLVSDWILLLWRPRILVYFMAQQQPFSRTSLKHWEIQIKVNMWIFAYSSFTFIGRKLSFHGN